MNEALDTRGWEAQLRLKFALRAERTRVVERQRLGPLALQRPFYPEGGICHAYLLHPPGGVVGGDSLEVELQLDNGAQALVTTPGATKFYRSDGRLARQTQILRVQEGALLEWLPQENIFFPGAQARLETRIELAAGARFIGWEMHCLGRPVIGEAFDGGELDARTRVQVGGQLRLIDQLHTRGRDLLDAAVGLRGYPMQASLVVVAGSDNGEAREQLLTQVRAVLDTHASGVEAGATALEELLVVRILGTRTEPVLRLLTALWRRIRPLVAGREAMPPRIWAT